MVSFIENNILNINHLQKETLIKDIGLNVCNPHSPPCSCITQYMLFTVHKKLSVAQTGDLNHTNYTLKSRHYITPHSALVKKKSLPTLSSLLNHVTGSRHTFYLALKHVCRKQSVFLTLRSSPLPPTKFSNIVLSW